VEDTHQSGPLGGILTYLGASKMLVTIRMQFVIAYIVLMNLGMISIMTREKPYYQIPDIYGWWSWNSATDALSDGYVNCSMSGSTSCYDNDDMVGTSKNSGVSKYTVNTREAYANGGDSGGPWVDSNNDLMGVHEGEYTNYLNDTWNYAAQAEKVMEDLGTTIY